MEDTFHYNVNNNIAEGSSDDNSEIETQSEQEQEVEVAQTKPEVEGRNMTFGSSKYSEGSLVWAKLSGYSHWPAVVTRPDMSVASNRKKIEAGIIHIHFFGYENDFAWLDDSALMPFTGMEDYENLKSKWPNQIADFVPSKDLADLFKKSCKIAETLKPIDIRKRRQILALDSNFVGGLESPKKIGGTGNGYPMISLLPSLADIFESERKTNPNSGELTDDGEEEKEGGGRIRLGSLVWAKQQGSPYWPAIISLSFEGSFSREVKKEPEYYCQFFNWKNQCAWIKEGQLKPWKKFEEIKSKEKLTPSEVKAWRPKGSIIDLKWRKAIEEAEHIIQNFRPNLRNPKRRISEQSDGPVKRRLTFDLREPGILEQFPSLEVVLDKIPDVFLSFPFFRVESTDDGTILYCPTSGEEVASLVKQ